MSRLGAWFRDALAAPREMLGNRDLRRLQYANLGSVLGNWAYVVGLAVYAYNEGGAGLVGLVTVIRMVPAALVGPFVAVLGDRFSRRGTMIGADVLRAAMLLAAAATIAADGPVWVVLTLVTLTNITAMAFRPAYQAILPGLSRTAEELTAANVATSTINSVGAVVGPAIGGLLLAVSSTSAVFALNGASFIWSAALVVAVREPGQNRLVRGSERHGRDVRCRDEREHDPDRPVRGDDRRGGQEHDGAQDVGSDHRRPAAEAIAENGDERAHEGRRHHPDHGDEPHQAGAALAVRVDGESDDIRPVAENGAEVGEL